eukprot:TRINITY_DN53908_c0_g1_i1.p1 TRINITY_DN53908_c0_g1~~TRINITY_DN53908_c0_g1_i1.p1  ORF type:complete len:485 (+),score=137.28 TRINITY_DN53908_c0_g1_i1:200-1654(+)
MGKDQFNAAWTGNIEEIAKMLDEGLEHTVDTSEYGNSNTMLHYAASNGQFEAVKLLLERGSSINTTNGSGCTALFLATQKNHVNIVRFLLDEGADPTLAEDTNGFCCLDVANRKLLKLLLKSLGSRMTVPDPPSIVKVIQEKGWAQINWDIPSVSAPIAEFVISIFECNDDHLDSQSGESGEDKYKLSEAILSLESRPNAREITISVENIPSRLPYATRLCCKITAINVCGQSPSSGVSEPFMIYPKPLQLDPPNVEVSGPNMQLSWSIQNPNYNITEFIVQCKPPPKATNVTMKAVAKFSKGWHTLSRIKVSKKQDSNSNSDGNSNSNTNGNTNGGDEEYFSHSVPHSSLSDDPDLCWRIFALNSVGRSPPSEEKYKAKPPKPDNAFAAAIQAFAMGGGNSGSKSKSHSLSSLSKSNRVSPMNGSPMHSTEGPMDTYQGDDPYAERDDDDFDSEDSEGNSVFAEDDEKEWDDSEVDCDEYGDW